MAEKQVEVDTIATFSDDDYGWIDAHQRKTVRADVAERWIAESKALPVLVEKRAVIETPEDSMKHETADLRRKKT
jgi:hypothetical protein